MSDQDLVLDAIEEAQRLMAEYVAPGPRRNPDETINMLLFLFDQGDVVAAVNRFRSGSGLRVAK
jgi:hypothetical protein